MTNSLLSRIDKASKGILLSRQTDEEDIRIYSKPESSYCSIANANPFFRKAIFGEYEYQKVVSEGPLFVQGENPEEIKKGY